MNLYGQISPSEAEAYQAYLVPALFTYWVPLLVKLARLQPYEQVLDAACGTGVVTRYVAEKLNRTGRVVGLDASPGMLAIARSLPLQEKVRIEWCEANILAMPFAEGEFDLLLCQHGLQYLPDRTAGLKEMYRVLKPGGRVALNVWRSLEYNLGLKAFSAALARHIGPEVEAITQHPFELGDREELFELLVGAGFDNITIQSTIGKASWPSVEEFVTRRLASPPLVGRIAEVSEEVRADLITTTRVALNSYLQAEGLVFPTASHLVLAYK